MSHLTEEEILELRAELERQIARLTRSMRVTEEAARPVELDQTAVGRLSRMDALQNQQLMQNLKEREEIRFAHLENALKRLEAGTYGVCTECDAAIRADRLFVFPETPVCAACG